MTGAVTYAGDKGPEMLDAIAAANHWLVPDGKGGWLADDPATVQPLIDGFIATAQKLRDIETAFAAKIAVGRNYGGKNYQIDAASQANIAAKATQALGVLNNVPGAQPWPTGFYWIATDNTHTPLDAAGMYAFAQDVGNYVAGLILNRRALKDAANAASAAAALAAIDPNSGYPAN
jgi:hypothetical protein